MQDVRHHLTAHGPARLDHPLKIEPELPVAVDEQDEPGQAVRPAAPDHVELRRRVEPRFVGLDDPDQSVSVHITMLGEPLVVAEDSRNLPRVADSDSPGPCQRRRLDRRGHR